MAHFQNIHARAPLLSSLPSCSYTHEKVRQMLAKSRPWSDPTETPITKSLRLLVALIVRNLVHYTPDLVAGMEQHEERLATIAMSSLGASKVVTDILQLAFGEAESEDPVFITHLPPFR